MNIFFRRAIFMACFVALLAARQAWATHIRAGDLTATRLQTGNPSVLTYRFRVVLYRDTEGVPPQKGTIDFGTGNPKDRVLLSPTSLGFINGGTTEVLLYQTTFTFPSAGTYKVSYLESNRNPGVVNMFDSSNTPFYIASTFRINPVFGMNNSPVLLIPPIDEARVGQRFIHNPGAYDPEGDSLSYRLTINKQGASDSPNNGLVINYRYPDALSDRKEDGSTPAQFSIDPHTGDLVWDAPKTPGEYNVAFYVDEWRDGILIGTVNRDMQIVVRDHNNERPKIQSVEDTCVVAGELLEKAIFAQDPDKHFVRLEVANDSGGIFRLPPPRQSATFKTADLQPPNGKEKGVFSWQTHCQDVRKAPYTVVFKAVDGENTFRNRLVDMKTWRIRVLGPPPDKPALTPDFAKAEVRLDWQKYPCANAQSMTIWRKEGNFPFKPVCQTGLPASSGYTQIGATDMQTLTFTDTNNGKGLKRGQQYCYRIFVRFAKPGGGESITSEEVCVFIPKIAPYITNVSIDTTSTTAGQIFVRWTKPIGADEKDFPRPHTYQLVRTEGGQNRTVIAKNFQENDTTFTDTSLNTADKVYRYYVRFFSAGKLVDSSANASSVRLNLASSVGALRLSWQATVPWKNKIGTFPYHYIYRKIEGEDSSFQLLDSVNVLKNNFSYTDKGQADGKPLEAGKRYCYRVATAGDYPQASIPAKEPLINFSQSQCDSIQVFVPQPAPFVTNVSTMRTDPKEGEILIRWTKVIGLDTLAYPRPHTYRIGVAEGFSGRKNYRLLPTVFAENDTVFTHKMRNTLLKTYNYRIFFYAKGSLIDSSAVASAVRLKLAAGTETVTLSWQAQTPWQNKTAAFRYHYIYRKEAGQQTFTLIDSLDVTQKGFRYTSRPPKPTQEYCYLVSTQGSYLNPFIREPLQNLSQEICAVLKDVTPPCLPLNFTLRSKTCDTLHNQTAPCPPVPTYENMFSWTPDRTEKCEEERRYRLYFKSADDSLFRPIATVTDTFFVHQNLPTIAGCYTLTALDSAGNETARMPEICIDPDCASYKLPNAFSPNQDGKNDRFRPYPCPLFVEKVHFKVYNRWGELVHESDNDIYLNWDGRHKNGKKVPGGLYYYTATVHFLRLKKKDRISKMRGWIFLLR